MDWVKFVGGRVSGGFEVRYDCGVRMERKLANAGYLRSFVFGVEDSLVSTVGLLSGVVAGGVGGSQVVLTGMILILVEAFSMAIGGLLSEISAEEYLAGKEVSGKSAVFGAVIMFVSYVVSGLIVLAPYIFLEKGQAVFLSIGSSLLGLVFLAVMSARMFKVSLGPQLVRMLALGTLAIGVGVGVARLVEGVV